MTNMDYIKYMLGSWYNIECKWIRRELEDVTGVPTHVCDRLYFNSKQNRSREVAAVAQDKQGNYLVADLDGSVEYVDQARRVRILGSIGGVV